MRKGRTDFTQIKENVANGLKTLSLSKKDRNFLMLLISLYDELVENKDEKFLIKLSKLIIEKNLENDEEIKTRLTSLKIQMDLNKYLEVRHFPHFVLYFSTEKVDIWPKKMPITWDMLISEIEKIDFYVLNLIVKKSITNEKRALTVNLNKINWKEKLPDLLENNAFMNTHITLYFNKI